MFFPNKPDEDWYWPVEILYTLEFSHCLISLCRSLFDFDSMKEIFSVNSERANGKRKCCCKKYSMNWAESKEAGPEAGQGRGKLVSYDWLTKSSPGLPVSIAQD